MKGREKKLTRKLTALLTVSAVFCLTACSTGAPPKEDSPKADRAESEKSVDDSSMPDEIYDLTTEEITLKMWDADEGGKKEMLEYAAGEFTKLYPNITFTFENVNHSDASAKIALDAPAGVGPDVFCAASDHMGSLVGSGLVLENQYAENFKDNYYSAAINAASYEGKMYGYPISLETYVLFYNKELIDSPPQTWEEVIEIAKDFNDPADNKYAIVWEAGDAYYDYMFTAAEGNYLFGAEGKDAASHNLNSEASVKGLTYFQNLRKEILDVPAGDLTWEFCMSEFSEGKAAMYITGAWSETAFTEAGINYGVTTLPGLPECDEPATSFSGARVMFVSSYSDHPKEAQAFLDFLCSKEMIQKRYEDVGELPSRSDIEITDENDLAYVAQLEYSFAMPAIPEIGTFWASMGSAVKNIWDGTDVREELDNAASAMEAAVE